MSEAQPGGVYRAEARRPDQRDRHTGGPFEPDMPRWIAFGPALLAVIGLLLVAWAMLVRVPDYVRVPAMLSIDQDGPVIEFTRPQTSPMTSLAPSHVLRFIGQGEAGVTQAVQLEIVGSMSSSMARTDAAAAERYRVRIAPDAVMPSHWQSGTVLQGDLLLAAGERSLWAQARGWL